MLKRAFGLRIDFRKVYDNNAPDIKKNVSTARVYPLRNIDSQLLSSHLEKREIFYTDTKDLSAFTS